MRGSRTSIGELSSLVAEADQPGNQAATGTATAADTATATVTICGFVDTIRRHSKVVFIVLRDETGAVQVVASPRPDEPYADQLDQLTVGSAVTVQGELVKNQIVKLGGVEIQMSGMVVDSFSEAQWPITDETSLDKRLDWRFLDLRKPENLLIFRAQTAVEEAFRELWAAEGFIEIHSPKLMASASETGSELFRLEYFDGYAYLAQSPQFYKQMAMAAGFGKVFEIGPVFRANPSFTSRHDTEFTSVDVEISWIDSHEDVMRVEEKMLQRALGVVKERYGHLVEEVFGTSITVPELPFPRVTHAQARKIVEDSGYRLPRTDGDLDPEAERRLSSHIADETGHGFVFVTDYPATLRPFYHMRHEEDPELTRSYDLLWNGLEITTGAQREHRYSVLRDQALAHGVKEDEVSYYLDFFRFGCPPHGGFGLGLTRILMILLARTNVREVTYLYRGPNRLLP